MIGKSREIEKLLLTSEEACEVLAISPRKLWSMKSAGEIPHVRVGRRVHYSIDDLRAWIEANRSQR